MATALNDRLAGPYACTGGETVLAYDFPVVSATDVKVLRRRDDTEETLTLDVDYTVSGVGNSGGGNILLTAPAHDDDAYVVAGDRAAARTSDLIQDRSFAAPVLNGEYDHLQRQVQELKRQSARSLLLGMFDASLAGGAFQAGGARIAGLADGILPTDAATKQQVDMIGGSAASAVAAALQAQTAAAAAQAVAAGTSVVAGAQITYDSRASVQAVTVPVGITTILVLRYSSSHPVAPAVYKRQSGLPLSFTDAGGATWGLAPTKVVEALWFGAMADGTTNDTAAIQAAVAAVVAGQTLRFSGTFVVNGCINIGTADIGIDWRDAKFLIGDSGTQGTLSNGAVGPIGFLFKDAPRVRVSDGGKFVGTGTVGSTKLAALVFDSCLHAVVGADAYYENLAAGRFVQWCDDAMFGGFTAYRMKGQQTFETGTAGSAEVLVGCADSWFGPIVSRENWKPIRYLSTAADRYGQKLDNRRCQLGFVSGTAAAGSAESSLISFRSAKNCLAAGGAGSGFSLGAYFVAYPTDTGFSVDGNTVGYIGGTFAATGSNGDAAVSQVTAGSGSPVLGRNTVLSVDATCAGEGAIVCQSGELYVKHCVVSGGTQPVVAQGCSLGFGTLIVSGATAESIVLYQGVVFSADMIDIRSGPVNSGVVGAIRYYDSSGSGGFGKASIGKIRYRQGAAAHTYGHVVFDNLTPFDLWEIQNIDGTGSTGPARFLGDVYSIIAGQIRGSAPPSGGSYTTGTQMWHIAPVAGGSAGWIKTTTTWKTFGSIGA